MPNDLATEECAFAAKHASDEEPEGVTVSESESSCQSGQLGDVGEAAMIRRALVNNGEN